MWRGEEQILASFSWANQVVQLFPQCYSASNVAHELSFTLHYGHAAIKSEKIFLLVNVPTKLTTIQTYEYDRRWLIHGRWSIIFIRAITGWQDAWETCKGILVSQFSWAENNQLDQFKFRSLPCSTWGSMLSFSEFTSFTQTCWWLSCRWCLTQQNQHPLTSPFVC